MNGTIWADVIKTFVAILFLIVGLLTSLLIGMAVLLGLIIGAIR